MSVFGRTNSPTNPFASSLFSLLPDFETIVRALRLYGRRMAVKQGKSLHSQLLRHGLSTPVFISNNLMGMYIDLKLFDDAHRVFDEMPERNVVSWTASISAHTHEGNPSEALRVFTQMLSCDSAEPNGYTFSAALKACAVVGDLEMGKWIHDRALRSTRMQIDTVLVNAVIDMYVKCGSLEGARNVFDRGVLLNCTSWNTMISGYANCGDMAEAEKLFCRVSEPDAVSFNTMIAGFVQREDSKALHYVRKMHKHGLKLDEFTFPCTLKFCGCLRLEKMGELLHNYIIKCGFSFSPFVGPSLIHMYSHCGQVNNATRVFDGYLKQKGGSFDKLPLLNSMVSGLVNNGFEKPALYLVAKIHHTGFEIDAFTHSTALKGCTNLQNIRLGLQVHGLIVSNGYQLDRVVGSVLIDFYAKCGKLEESLRLFLKIPHKDLIAWSGLITRCVQQGSYQLAFSLFKDMIHLQLEVDHFVITSVLKACASLPWLYGGEQVHAFCNKIGFASENFILTSLIDLHSKCGNIEDGLKIFRTITQKDTTCWTGMILGCGYNGRATEAIELFHNMIKSGEKPNEITFIVVLSACRHAGLVEEACNIFNTMKQKHDLVPTLEHYCCMVDILSRAGLFEEARKMVSLMPYEPDETIRNCLLGDSMIHQNSDFGEVPFPPCDASGYVTLSNIYGNLGMWERSAELRRVMRRVGTKETGRSWIEVRD